MIIALLFGILLVLIMGGKRFLQLAFVLAFAIVAFIVFCDRIAYQDAQIAKMNIGGTP